MALTPPPKAPSGSTPAPAPVSKKKGKGLTAPPSAAPPATKKKGSQTFWGIDLPKIGPVDLPAIGVHKGPGGSLKTLRELTLGLPGNLVDIGRGVGTELYDMGGDIGAGGTSGSRVKLPGAPRPRAGVSDLSAAERYPTLRALVPDQTLKNLNPADIAKVVSGDFGKTSLGKQLKREGYLGAALHTVGDVTTLAMGAGAGLKAVGATGLAEKAGSITSLGAQVGGAPAKLFTVPLGKLAHVPAVETAVRAIIDSPKTQTALEAMRLDPVSKAFKARFKEYRNDVTVAAKDVMEAHPELIDVLPSHVDQAAAILSMTDEAKALAHTLSLTDDAAVIEAMTQPLRAKIGKGGQRLVGEEDAVIARALEWNKNGPSPEAQRFIDVFTERISAPGQTAYLEGRGAIGITPKGLKERAEQTGSEPLSAPVKTLEKTQGKRRATVEKAKRTAETTKYRRDGSLARMGRAERYDRAATEAQRLSTELESLAARTKAARSNVRKAETAAIRGTGTRAELAAAQREVATTRRLFEKARTEQRVHAKTIRRIEREWVGAERQLQNLTSREVKEMSKLLDSAKAQPARYRNVSQYGREVQRNLKTYRETLADDPIAQANIDRMIPEVLTTLKQFDEAGIDPMYIQGGRAIEDVKGVAGGGAPRMPRFGRSGAARAKEGTTTPLTAEGQVKGTVKRIETEMRNEFGAKLGRDMGTKGATIGADLKGQALVDAAAEQGLVPYHIQWKNRDGKVVTKFGGSFKNIVDRIDGDTVFVPQVLEKNFTSYTRSMDKAMLKFYDRGTTLWKHGVLALSPRWHVGNIVSNSMQTMVAGGIKPTEIAEYAARAKKMIETDKYGRYLDESFPMEFRNTGFLSDEAHLKRTEPGVLGRKVNELTGGRTRNMTGDKSLIARSYRFNEKVDNLAKAMVYLKKVDQGLNHETAVRLSLRAIGDFGNFTPFERNVVKRLFPFYAWQRHTTKLAMSLPVTNPTRVAWLLHLSDMAMEDLTDAEKEERLRGYVTLPVVGRVNVNNVSPLSRVAGLSAQNQLYGLNPILKTGVAAGTGANLSRGAAPVSMPGQKFGTSPGALIDQPGALLRFAGQQLPLTGQIQDLAENLRGNESPSRFNTGEPIKKRKAGTKGPVKRREGEDLAKTLLRFLGVA